MAPQPVVLARPVAGRATSRALFAAPESDSDAPAVGSVDTARSARMVLRSHHRGGEGPSPSSSRDSFGIAQSSPRLNAAEISEKPTPQAAALAHSASRTSLRSAGRQLTRPGSADPHIRRKGAVTRSQSMHGVPGVNSAGLASMRKRVSGGPPSLAPGARIGMRRKSMQPSSSPSKKARSNTRRSSVQTDSLGAPVSRSVPLRKASWSTSSADRLGALRDEPHAGRVYSEGGAKSSMLPPVPQGQRARSNRSHSMVSLYAGSASAKMRKPSDAEGKKKERVVSGSGSPRINVQKTSGSKSRSKKRRSRFVGSILALLPGKRAIVADEQPAPADDDMSEDEEMSRMFMKDGQSQASSSTSRSSSASLFSPVPVVAGGAEPPPFVRSSTDASMPHISLPLPGRGGVNAAALTAALTMPHGARNRPQRTQSALPMPLPRFMEEPGNSSSEAERSASPVIAGIVKPRAVRPGTSLARSSSQMTQDEEDHLEWSFEAMRSLAPSPSTEHRELTVQDALAYPIVLPTVHDSKICEHTIGQLTTRRLLKGDYRKLFDKVIVVDARYDYEYEGGHIRGALNFACEADAMGFFFGAAPVCDDPARTVIIIHCEFSSERGPRMWKRIRTHDRARSVFPYLQYPYMFLLSKGYSQFYSHEDVVGHDCCDGGYRSMFDTAFEDRMKACREVWKKPSSRRSTSTMGSGRSSPALRPQALAGDAPPPLLSSSVSMPAGLHAPVAWTALARPDHLMERD